MDTQKFKIIAVTGGIPRYLEEIDSNQSAEYNIKQLCFKKRGFLTNEFEKIFSDLFSRWSKIYKDLITCCIDGPASIKEICARLGVNRTGLISSYLEDLVKANFLARDHTWLLKSAKYSLLSRFRISDNYLRFYLKYIQAYMQLIEQDGFKDKSLNSLPGWSTIMGLQFQNLVLHNRHYIRNSLHLLPEDVVIDNPYFQKSTAVHKGCQIDYMIQTKFNNLFACEIKFSKNEISTNIIQEMQDKLARLILPRGFSCWPVLIHVNGVNEKVEDSGYFTKIIDFS